MINAALERAGGNFGLAATLMGMEEAEVRHAVRFCKELQVRWSKSNRPPEAPTQAQTIHRPMVDFPTMPGVEILDREPTKDERSLVKGLIQEDEALKERIEYLGLTPEEATLALGLQKFQEESSRPSVQIIMSSLTRVCLKMSTAVVDCQKRVDEVRERIRNKELTVIERKEASEEEERLMKTLIALANQVRLMAETINHGAMCAALTKYRAAGRQPPQRKTKPGFQSYIDLPDNGNGDRRQ